MDADSPLNPRYLPEGLDMDRFYRWCVRRTLRDLRLSASRRRLMSLPNVLRLLHRRWAHAPVEDAPPSSQPRPPVGLTAPWADAHQPPDLATARRQIRAAYRFYTRRGS